MNIWVGIITHKHGTNFYAAKTAESLYQQLADYCREYWSDLEIDAEASADNETCVADYFEFCEWESFEADQIEVL